MIYLKFLSRLSNLIAVLFSQVELGFDELDMIWQQVL